MDETENEEQGAGPLSTTAMSPADYVRRFETQQGVLRQARADEASARREMFEQAQQRLQAPQGLRFGSPEVTQTLFGLANALVSPRPYGGFAGTMANVMPVLSQSARSMSDAQQQRAASLRELQEQYQLGTASAATAAASDDLGALGELARFYEQPTPPQPIWSESLQRFIPRGGEPTVVGSRALPDGSRADRLTDGTTRVTTASGQVGFYDAGGNPINQGGAQ